MLLLVVPISCNGADSRIRVRATLSTNDNTITPELRWWQATVSHISLGEKFVVRLVNLPTSVSATPNVNYKTLIRWDYDEGGR